MKTSTQSHGEFVDMLNKVLGIIREKATLQYEYNLNTNIPNKISDIILDNAAEHAIKSGIVSGVNAWLSWDCDETIRLAHHFLEDANCHTEARELVKFIPEYQLK